MSGPEPSSGNELLIVDGYNVLHTTGVLRGIGPGALERGRNILIGLARRALPGEKRERTTLVFDSRQSGLAPRIIIDGLTVEFARDHESADERIIELVSRHSAPRRLTVVSSDRAIRQAARGRGSRNIASEDWLEEISRGAKQRRANRKEPASESPSLRDAADVDVAWWLSQMNLADTSELGEIVPGETEPGGSGIFPPGYADELLDDDSGTV